MKRAFIPLIIFVLLAACAPVPPPVADNREAALKDVRTTEESVVKAFSDRNAELATSFYAPNAVLMEPNMALIQGAAIGPALKAMLSDPNVTMTFQPATVEAGKAADLGYVRGTYTVVTTDPATRHSVTEHGKYLTIYARQADGSWKITEDISNADAPAR